MRSLHLRCRAGLIVAAAVLIGATTWYYLLRPDPGDPRLKAFVHHSPPVPIVFTSRSEPLSLVAAAPRGEEFVYPGKRLWAAREGRLRLLTPRGTVHELTWGKQLPDGSTLIDVMSPSISLDGKRIYFAGRKGGADSGHFRLYEIGIDGDGLRQLTGGSDDTGCAAVPPLRFRADGSTLADAERKAIDYDDIDPVELSAPGRRIAFVSTRTPDLGRDHARRSTTLWIREDGSQMTPASANRNNDRWPFLFASRVIAFSLWSRNREVITADGMDIRPFEEGMACATRPTDHWLGAFQQVAGSQFGHIVKTPIPVWRMRPLFNGQVAFMTTLAEPGSYADDSLPPLRAVQASPGLLANAPSSLSASTPLPAQSGSVLSFAPSQDESGHSLWTATPSPCPPHEIVLAAAPVGDDNRTPEPGKFGIYLADDNWRGERTPTMSDIRMRLLFDDPDFVDAEPVAVYARAIEVLDDPHSRSSIEPVRQIETTLANGSTYRGPAGLLFATALYEQQMDGLPGQRTDRGQGPIFTAPPRGSIDHLRIYAAHRDRFDDPIRPRIPGQWELLLKVPVRDGVVNANLPVGSPVVLAGFDREGRVVAWTSLPTDSLGRQATFFAYAGDHYSLVKPVGKPFCTGCHAGHNGFPPAMHDQHRERTR